MSPIEALSWILRKAQGATDSETGKVIDVGYEVQVIKLNIDADRHRLKQRIDEIDELEGQVEALQAKVHLCAGYELLQAENERLRHALEFITTTRPDGTPAYGELLMFGVALDALEATMQVHCPAEGP
jgi:hypothetical protein